ncbi:MAG TPA: MarR family transcriptional regulator, partial [Deltaproteobacteria bacterium]|nr:MarR family transcriptional regulator [Deltaproteobacteria bacterium]
MNDDLPDGSGVLRLDHYWPYQITVLADRIARRTTRIVKAHGLNLSQWRV